MGFLLTSSIVYSGALGVVGVMKKATTFPVGAAPTRDLMVPDGLWLPTTVIPVPMAFKAALQTLS